jgi:hypothetical protein
VQLLQRWLAGTTTVVASELKQCTALARSIRHICSLLLPDSGSATSYSCRPFTKVSAADNMTEIVDVRKVVAKMRLLASNAENRPFIAKDKGCLRGLLAFLDNASDDIVFTAMEALLFLCMHHPNVSILQAVESLPEKVAGLASNDARGQDIQNIAAQLDAVLKSGSSAAGHAASALAVRSPMKDRSNQQQALLSSPAKSPSFKTPAKTTVSTICLKIEGVTSENDRSVIERSIVSLKGTCKCSPALPALLTACRCY